MSIAKQILADNPDNIQELHNACQDAMKDSESSDDWVTYNMGDGSTLTVVEDTDGNPDVLVT